MTEIEELKKRLLQAKDLRNWVLAQTYKDSDVHRWAHAVLVHIRDKLSAQLLERELKE